MDVNCGVLKVYGVDNDVNQCELVVCLCIVDGNLTRYPQHRLARLYP